MYIIQDKSYCKDCSFKTFDEGKSCYVCDNDLSSRYGQKVVDTTECTDIEDDEQLIDVYPDE